MSVLSPLTSGSLPISSLEASLVPAQFVAITLTVYMELRAANASELTTEKDTLLAGMTVYRNCVVIHYFIILQMIPS